MKKQQVMVCLGTRPEAIKLAPVIKALAEHPRLSVLTAATGQHREMLDQMLGYFGIEPEVDLNLMTHQQGLADLAAGALQGVTKAIEEHKPAAVVVQGDTNTAFAGALAAFYAGVPVAHVEAGLRTGNPRLPFPEEINRRLVAPLAQWHFCPTAKTATNLLDEGVPARAVEITGNTVIDALLEAIQKPMPAEHADMLAVTPGKRRVLVTLHRRETQGDAQRRLCRALAMLANRSDVEILLPVHRNPAVRDVVEAELGRHESVKLVEPLEYPAFVHALKSSELILTDSGGVQEEAPALNVPVLVMRDTTERPEGVDNGCSILCGTSPEKMLSEATRLLDNRKAWKKMARAANPYGDGTAAQRIVESLDRGLHKQRDNTVAPLPLTAPALPVEVGARRAA